MKKLVVFFTVITILAGMGVACASGYLMNTKSVAMHKVARMILWKRNAVAGAI